MRSYEFCYDSMDICDADCYDNQTKRKWGVGGGYHEIRGCKRTVSQAEAKALISRACKAL
jgi:hypothetical protein